MIENVFCVNIEGAEVVIHGSFESGTSSYIVDDVQCSGDEGRLIDCPHISNPNCDTGLEDAGVRCLHRGKSSFRHDKILQ